MSKKPWMGLAALVTVCSWGTLVVGTANAESKAVKAPSRNILDVALDVDGTAQGLVVDEQGQPVADAKVEVRYQNKTIAKVVSNNRGQFSVQKMRGGVHTLHSQGGVAICRLWTTAAAPPAAKSRLLVVSRARLIRAQCGELGCSVGDATGGMMGGIVHAPATVAGCADGSCGGWSGGGWDSNVMYYDANCNPVYSDMNFMGWGGSEALLTLGAIGGTAAIIASNVDDDDDAPASP